MALSIAWSWCRLRLIARREARFNDILPNKHLMRKSASADFIAGLAQYPSQDARTQVRAILDAAEVMKGCLSRMAPRKRSKRIKSEKSVLMREIVLDTETTGLDLSTGDGTVEIGCPWLVGRPADWQTHHVYINPDATCHARVEARQRLASSLPSDFREFLPKLPRNLSVSLSGGADCFSATMPPLT